MHECVGVRVWVWVWVCQKGVHVPCGTLPHWQVFKEAIKAAVAYKENSTDIMDAIMRELEVGWAGGGGAVCGMAASCA